MREDIHFKEAPSCGVGQSKIQGQGLFALRDFQPGDTVADYSGSNVQECGFDSMPEKYKQACWWVGASKETALLFPPESAFMRANHSRNPNCLWEPEEKTLTAIRAIPAGEEITYDYRKEIAPESWKSSPPPWA